MSLQNASPVVGYATAFASVAVATLLRLGMNSIWEQRLPYLVFFPAIVVSGLVGGFGPGVLAIFLSAAAVSFFVLPPIFTFKVGSNEDIAGLAAFGLTGLLLAFISASQRQARLESARSAAEAILSRDALKISEERFVTTLRSIGDGVLATDAAGKVTFLNAIAADLTGWTESKAAGRDVHEVFDIINETTRQPVANPVNRVLKEGVVVGLANHTILRSRSGREYAIDDSGAPIHDSQGQLVGAVLVFRDISEQRQIQREQESLARRNAVENRIGEALRSGMAPLAIQAVATAALGEALDADRCYLSLVNVAAGRIVVHDDWRRDPNLPSLSGAYPLETITAEIPVLYPPGRPVATTDLTAPSFSPTVQDYSRQLQVRSAITLGLYRDDVLIAAINVAMSEQPRQWKDDEIALVESVAALTLTVVESARLRDQEHNIAVRLQEALRPTLPNQIIPDLDIQDLYLAALDESSLGGDFFDVFPLSKTRCALVVADLAGKGLKAASQVAVVRYLLRALLYTSGKVGTAVTELNRILAEQNLITGFATLFVGVYDAESKLFIYVCCGQEPGLHYEKRSGSTKLLSASGPVLGTFADATFEERVTELLPGDAVALFTDGLTECGPDRVSLLEIEGILPLWEEALQQEFTAASLSGALLSGALRHAGGSLSDDLCLLTVVVRPAA